MKANKINPVFPTANKANGDSLDASEWNALTAAMSASQTEINNLVDDMADQKQIVVLSADASFASQVTTPGTTYVIRESVSLDGASADLMPYGCTLRFEGGSLRDGSLVLDYTTIEGDVVLNNVVVTGSCANKVLTPQLFGATGSGLPATADDIARDTQGFSNLVSVLNDSDTRSKVLYITSGDYHIDEKLDVRVGCKVYGDGEQSVLHCYDGVGGLSFGDHSDEHCELLDCTLSVVASKGDMSITVTDASDIQAGDYLILTDMADGSFCKDRRGYRTSELVRVSGVDNNVVTLYSGLYGSYKTGVGTTGTIHDDDDNVDLDALLFEDGEATTITDKTTARTAISKFTPSQYLLSDFKVVSHEHNNADPDTYYTLRVYGHINSEFRNLVIENHGNYTATSISMGTQFKVEHCSIKSYTAFTSDAYGLVLSNVQNYRVSNSTFRSRSHALATGGSGGLWSINNRDFVYEKIKIDGSNTAGTKVDIDVHANAEYWKLRDTDAPFTCCNLGGYNMVVENCRFRHISTGFNQGCFTLRNCEIMVPRENLMWFGYDNVDYGQMSVVVEGCKIHGYAVYNLQDSSRRLHRIKTFIWRNNICNGLRLLAGRVENIVLENNTVLTRSLSCQLGYENMRCVGNYVMNGCLLLSSAVPSVGVVSGNIIMHDGSDSDSYTLILGNMTGKFFGNSVSCELSRTLIDVTNGSNIEMYDNTFRQGVGTIDGAIGDVFNESMVVFNRNLHNSTRTVPIYANNSRVKCDKNGYYVAADADKGILSTIGETVYYRNLNKMGYISSGETGARIAEMRPYTGHPVVMANPFEKGKVYYVKFRINGNNNFLYFSKTEEIDESDLLMVIKEGSANNAVFCAPDPTEYPYVYAKTTISGIVEDSAVWFRFYENRMVSDYDGAKFNTRRSGTTAQRPANGQDVYVGFEYFDTTLNKPVYVWNINADNSINWKDSLGGAADMTYYSKPNSGIPSTDLSAAVQASLGRADKLMVTAAVSIENIINQLSSASTQGGLTTLRTTLSGAKLILFPSNFSSGGYVTATVTGTGSTLTFEFTYNGVYYEVTGDASDVWSITKQQNLMLVQAYPDIDMRGIVTTGTISSANVTALIAMRSKNAHNAQILVGYGNTLVPATVTTYGSGFNMFCFVEGSHGEPIMVHISADASDNNWTATVTNLYVKPSGGIPATDLASAVRTALTAAGTALQPADLNTLNGKVAALESLVSEDGTPVDTVIDKFNEIVTFLAGITTTDTLAGIIGDISSQIAAKASKSEMSVVAGTGADADKTTITLKSGTSATVLTSHQSLSNYYNKTEVDGKIVDSIAGRTEHAKTLSGYVIESEYQRKLESGTSIKTINGGSVLGSGNLSLVESTSVRTVVVISQSDYDALATKDTNTEYNIIESV